ncbi:MAG TPA: hypothetical protein H9868_02350 [Candidatus Flavonifractor merdipullorum]|uniref:Uncharacterized protein n=1 Tax=Candidatus Flavonifractor merdipullorum TaxID=2838590 RepID=A0A9D1RTC3_9FIRM|nr:hypothetical protein [Candidatus Flavonifractor merdipullorum]
MERYRRPKPQKFGFELNLHAVVAMAFHSTGRHGFLFGFLPVEEIE